MHLFVAGMAPLNFGNSPSMNNYASVTTKGFIKRFVNEVDASPLNEIDPPINTFVPCICSFETLCV